MTICGKAYIKEGVGAITLVTRSAVKPPESNIPLSLRKGVGNFPPRVGTDPGDVLRSLVCTLLSIVASPPCTAMFECQPGHVFQLLGGELNVVLAVDDTLSEGVVSATNTIFVCVSRPWCIREPITCGDFEHWPEDKMHSSFHSDHGGAEYQDILCGRLGTPGQGAFVDLHISGILCIAQPFGFNKAALVLHDAGASTVPAG